MMRYVKRAINGISGDKYGTASLVLPLLGCLKGDIQNKVPETSYGHDFEEYFLQNIS